MLMDCASAIAKLRGGHLLQFSTNNQNETFNGIVKSRMSRQQSLPDLIKKLDAICNEKLRECWLSGIDGSEYVYFSIDVEGDCLEDKIAAYSSTGLISSRTLALSVPLSIAEGFNLQKLNREELAVDHLRCTKSQDNMFHLEDSSLPQDDRNRFVHVQVRDNFQVECWQCVNTLPDYLCRHVIFCLCRMKPEEVDSFWMTISRAKPKPKVVNAFSAKSGLKPSDRIGTAKSARNHVRTITDISSMSFASNSSTTSTPVQIASPSLRLPSPSSFSPNASFNSSPISFSTPTTLPQNADVSSSSSSASSAERRSSRKRRPFTKYSPTYDYDYPINDISANSTIY